MSVARGARSVSRLVVVAAAAALFAAATPASAASVPDGTVLVRFRGQTAPQAFRYATVADADAALARFRTDPTVAVAAKDGTVRMSTDQIVPNDEYYLFQWFLERIDAPQAWKLAQGSRTVVAAVLDTGVQLDHPDLRNNIWTNPREVLDGLDNDGNGYPDDVHGWDFVDDVGDPQPHLTGAWNADGVDHGTNVAGLIGAVGNNRIGVAGVAWNVRIMPVRVLDSSGIGDVEAVAKGIDYAVRNGAQVMNLSFVGSERNAVLEDAIRRAHDAGVTIVVAAGNDSDGTGGTDLDADPRYPACSDGGAGHDDVIGVAASDQQDRKAVFSDYGSHCVDITAPGVAMYGTDFHFAQFAEFSSLYGPLGQGTSLATPLVTGAAALLKSMDPSLTNDAIRDVLKRTATPIDALNPAYAGKLGAGRLDLNAAVQYVAASQPQGVASRAEIGVGAPPGLAPEVRLFTRDGAFVRSFLAYPASFRGGVTVAAGDLDGDLHDEIVVAPTSKGGPHVRVFDASGLLKGEFFAYDAAFLGGVNVAVGDLDGDGKAEIVVAPATGTGQVRVFDGDGKPLASFFPYDPAFRGGVSVAVGDLDGDGKAEIATGAGPGGGPQVRVFDAQGNAKRGFFAGSQDDRHGIRVAVGDTQRQGAAGIAVMAASGTASRLSLYTQYGVLYGLLDVSSLAKVFPFTLGDVDGSGRASILVSVPTSDGISLAAYDTDGKERAYVASYPKGTVGLPAPFVLERP